MSSVGWSTTACLLACVFLMLCGCLTTGPDQACPEHGPQEGAERYDISDGQIGWYHDCSNITGWTLDPDPPQPFVTVQSDLAIESNGSVIRSSDIPAHEGLYHGSTFFYELPFYTRLRSLIDFRITAHHPSTANRTGGLYVSLYDEQKIPSAYIGTLDKHNDSATTSRFWGYTEGFTTEGGIVTNGEWLMPLWVYYDSEEGNLIGAEYGTLSYLALAGDFNELRHIRYIGITFYNYQDCSYESDELLSISLVAGDFSLTGAFIDHPEDIVLDEQSTGNHVEWNHDVPGPTGYHILRNGTEVDSGPWTGGVITVDLDGLSPSVYNYTNIIEYGASETASDSVFVTIMDTTTPSLGGPPDFSYEAGTTGHTISWSAFDSAPDSYVVMLNDTVYESGVWNGTAVVIDIDGLDPAVYLFSFFVNDTTGHSATDSVILTVVDTTPPSVTHPEDFEYELGTSGNEIAWNTMDLYQIFYQVYVDDVLSGDGNVSGSEVKMGVDGLELGLHNLTVWLEDEYGNSATDTVMLNVVDTTPPELDAPPDLEYTEGQTENWLRWNPYDLKPASFRTLVNGSLDWTGIWTGSDIAIGVDGLQPGAYLYEIQVFDTSGNMATDTVLVLVRNAPPLFSSLDLLVFALIIIAIGLGYARRRSRGD